METKQSITQSTGIRISFNEQNEEVGHIYLFLIKNDLHERPYGLIEDLCVAESKRGKGVGTELLQEAIKEAQKQNCYKIIANSRAEREKVHHFYEKNKFEKYGFEFRYNL